MHGAGNCGCGCDHDVAARTGCRFGPAASSCSGPTFRLLTAFFFLNKVLLKAQFALVKYVRKPGLNPPSEMDVIDVAAIDGPAAALVRIVKGTVLMVYKCTGSAPTFHFLLSSGADAP
jgi:hypothetical protein